MLDIINNDMQIMKNTSKHIFNPAISSILMKMINYAKK